MVDTETSTPVQVTSVMEDLSLERPKREHGMADWNCYLERCVESRTNGRVHGLSIEAVDDRIIVHGHTSSYYALQAAICALNEALSSLQDHPMPQLQLDVQVLPEPNRRFVSTSRSAQP